MLIRSIKILCLVLCLSTFSLSMTGCTSSDDETSVLEDEIQDIDSEANEEEMDDIEELGEISEDDLEDEVDEDEDFGEGDDEVADLEDDDFDQGDDDFDDEEFSDDEEEFADNEEDPEFDEFDEFDDEENNDGKQKEFAQNEQSLQQELNNQKNYPVIENAQPAFPQEVISQNGAPVSPVPAPVPLATDGTIVSETQDIALEDPNVPKLPQDDLGKADPLVPVDEDDNFQAQTWVPVVKIKNDPFFRNQRLMNAVYIARPQENLQSISQKIYAADRSEELKSDNPHLAKGIDPGDKVYYNSPNRPNDKTLLKFYYSDIGLAPQTYQTKNGDNMRRLGSRLLGFPEGWKEVWAINPSVDSKTILPSGLDIKYWTGEESSPEMQLADNNISDSTLPEEDMGTAGTVQDFSEPELPPEPPLPEAEIAMPENNLEPQMVPDIEPFPEQGIEQTPTPVASSANNNESLLSAGAMALLLIAGVGLVAIQIKKRKDMTGMTPRSMEYTQV